MNTGENPVARRLEEIQETFRQAQHLAQSIQPPQVLANGLNKLPLLFRSVGYEAAAMVLALYDFESGEGLPRWHQFLATYGTPHAAQMHIGLGWAIAQQQVNPHLYITSLAPLYAYRVFDGMGYYDGLFRRRKSIIAMVQPGYRDEEALQVYDQGLGRSLWYSNKGNSVALNNAIQAFSERRRPSLWRGAGIASTYAGPCLDEELNALLLAAGVYHGHLRTGAAIAAISRYEAGSTNKETDHACAVYLLNTLAEIVQIHQRLLQPFKQRDQMPYGQWVQALHLSLQVSTRL